MQCPRWDSIPGPLALQTTALPTELKEISTNAVSRGGYEPTTVPITLGVGSVPVTLPPPQESSYLDEDISNINIQSDQFSCSDQRGLFSWAPM